MKKITKVYKIYKFEELSKKKQNSIKQFRFDCECRNMIMGGGQLHKKFIKALAKYVDKEVREFVYFKNGDIANIPE